jgi:hypothetical protein
MTAGKLLDGLLRNFGEGKREGTICAILNEHFDGTTVLDLSHLSLDFGDIRRIHRMPSLDTLDLSFTGTKDHWLKLISDCRSLKSLSLVGNHITDASFLIGHKNLQILDLQHNPLNEIALVKLFHWSSERMRQERPIKILADGLPKDLEAAESLRRSSRNIAR